MRRVFKCPMYDETPTDYCIFYPTRGERVAKFLIVRRIVFGTQTPVLLFIFKIMAPEVSVKYNPTICFCDLHNFLGHK